jgi:hypothetical protein
MDLFTLTLHGPVWLYALLAVVATAAAVITYRGTVPSVYGWPRTVLIVLRSVALALLLLTLFEPLATFIASREQSPRVALLVDRSRSAGMTVLSDDRAAAVRRAVADLVTTFGDDVDVILFDDNSTVLSADSTQGVLRSPFSVLRFEGGRTNLSAPLHLAAHEAARHAYRSVILITDGNANSGDSPLLAAERSGMPVHVLAVGDSVAPPDLIVRGLNANAIAYVAQPTPVSVEVAATRLSVPSVKVVLDDNGTIVAEQDVNLGQARRATTTLTWTPSTAGTHKLTARVSAVDGEFTTKNNSVMDFVTVRSTKRRIALFAGAPSPDVAMVRSILESDKDVTVDAVIQKSGSEFYGVPPSGTTLRDAETMVLVGFPNATTPRTLIEEIARAALGGTPVLFIASQQTDYARLGPLADILPFSVAASRPQESLVQIDVSPSATSDPVLMLGATDDAAVWNALPPIFRTETFVRLAPQSTVLATMRVNNRPLSDPLLLRREADRVRCIAMLGYGLYRWRLLGGGPARLRGEALPDAAQLLVRNGLRWLSVNDDRDRIRIKPTRTSYTAGEVVQFNASVADAALAPVDGATVSVVITGNGTSTQHTMEGLGNGRYGLNVGTLPAGDYSYVGTVRSRDAVVGERTGRFTVGASSIEYEAIAMNAPLLRAIADRTGGSFRMVRQAGDVPSAVRDHPAFRPSTITQRSEHALWSLPLLLAVAIVCFTIEWVLRKRLSLP